jgi:hypothetical protein
MPDLGSSTSSSRWWCSSRQPRGERDRRPRRLAIGCTLIAAAAFTGLAYVAGHRVFSEYLDVLFLPRRAR